MHIPTSMLNGAICPVTLAISAVGIGITVTVAKKSKTKPSSARFAAVTALIFALQMLNYPVQNGTSGHLVGALLGVSFLGIPFAILSMTIVLTIQAIFFGDGGMNSLGANILNMSIIGAGLLGFAYHRMKEKGLNHKFSLGAAALLSVLAGVIACSIEVGISGTITFNKVLPAMFSIHILIGLGEALLTVIVVTALSAYETLWQKNERQFAIGACVLAGFAALASPFASNFPDGLEWVAQKLSFKEFAGLEIPAMFPDYQATFINNEGLATVFAAIAGIALVFCITFTIGQMIKHRQTKTV